MIEDVNEIFEPTTESQRTYSLLTLWDNVQYREIKISKKLETFIINFCTKNWVQSAIIGLLLDKLEGKIKPTPPYILVRVFPALFDDEHPEIQKIVKELFQEQSILDFFIQTSERNLFSQEKDKTEEWYAMRILGNFTREICENYDKNNNNQSSNPSSK